MNTNMGQFESGAQARAGEREWRSEAAGIPSGLEQAIIDLSSQELSELSKQLKLQEARSLTAYNRLTDAQLTVRGEKIKTMSTEQQDFLKQEFADAKKSYEEIKESIDNLKAAISLKELSK